MWAGLNDSSIEVMMCNQVIKGTASSSVVGLGAHSAGRASYCLVRTLQQQMGRCAPCGTETSCITMWGESLWKQIPWPQAKHQWLHPWLKPQKRPWARTTQLSHSWPRNNRIVNVSCLKPASFTEIVYAAINIYYNILYLVSFLQSTSFVFLLCPITFLTPS